MRKKSNLKLLFVLLTAGIASVQAATAVFAGDFPERTCGENLTWALSDGILTISGTGDMYDYDRYETPWYSSASAIRKVITDDDVTRIGANSFYGCKELTEVVLGRGVASVGEFAFCDCSALHTFTPGDATHTIDSAFFDTDRLTTILLRNSVTKLSNTFRDMDTVTTFEVDDTDGTGFYMSGDTLYHRETVDGEEIKTLVKYPEGLPLTGTYVPESDTDIIGDKAFYNQELLEEVILPEGIYEIEEFAFRGCSALHTFTPGDTTRTVDSAFFDTDSLALIILRNTVTELSSALRDLSTVTAFEAEDTDGIGYYDVNGILYHYDILEDETVKTLVKCPEGNKFTGTYTAESGTNIIGENAFYGQNLLEAVYLPESVYKVSSHAFYGCTALHGVYFYGKPPVSLPNNTFQNCPSDLILYYIEGTEGWTDPWKGYDTEPFLAKDPVTGDVNGDSIVDTTDIQILIRIFAGWLRRYSDYLKPILNINAVLDLNKDGFFNSKDVMILNRYLNGWEGFSQYFE